MVGLLQPGQERRRTRCKSLDVNLSGPAALLLAIHGLTAAPLWAAAPSDAAEQFAKAIDTLNSLDPQSPETLNTRLDYADFLAKVEDGDCQKRLDQAQDQLDLVRASPVVGIALPWGAARESGLEYQIHIARTSCVASAPLREQELRAALDSARRAVELYRDALDAVAMVTMQFNTSVAYRSLGDNEAAIAALRTTLEMDREYGYEDDAKDNYQLLLQWTGEEAGPTAVAQRMADFPKRSTTLNFVWFESNADVSLETDYSQSANGTLLHIHGSRTAQRRVREGLRSWVVSYQPRDAHFEFGAPPNEDTSSEGFINSLTRMLLQCHDFRLARDGDYAESMGTFKFDARVRAEANQLTRDLVSKNANTALTRGVHKAVAAALSPDEIEDIVAENYNLQTGTWIGAKLEQGVWYDMDVPLSVPLAPNIYVMHKIQFAYTRPVPCTADSTDLSCVEIMLRATPDPEVLKTDLEKLAYRAHVRKGQVPRLWSVTYLRLVADPDLLQPYILDMRRHSYWSSGATGPNQSLTESDRTVFVSGRISRAEGR